MENHYRTLSLHNYTILLCLYFLIQMLACPSIPPDSFLTFAAFGTSTFFGVLFLMKALSYMIKLFMATKKQ